MPRPALIRLQQTQIEVLRTVDDSVVVAEKSKPLDCSRPCFPPCEIVIDFRPAEIGDQFSIPTFPIGRTPLFVIRLSIGFGTVRSIPILDPATIPEIHNGIIFVMTQVRLRIGLALLADMFLRDAKKANGYLPLHRTESLSDTR